MEEREPLIVGKHYTAIDGLRGLAVLLVLWFHASYFVLNTYDGPLSGTLWIYAIFSVMGKTGVDLFFVLSGFLITGILIDTRHHKHRIRNFYIRRILRIFPLYYGILFVFIAYFLYMPGLDEGSGGLDHSKTAIHLFYFQNWLQYYNADQFTLLSHTWSLAIEEQFYLFWPLIFLSFYKSKKLRPIIILCCVLILFSWGLRLYLCAYESYKGALMFTSSRLDGLSLGALLSIICVQKPLWLKRMQNFLPYIMAGCLVIVTIVLFVGAWQRAGSVTGIHDYLTAYGLTIFSILYVSLLAYVMSPSTSKLKSRLSNKYMRILGKVSYGLYLFHWPVMVLIAKGFSNIEMNLGLFHVIVFFGGGGISFILAYLSYYFYEKFFLRLKNKWAPLE